jgi:cytidylate kinase
MAIITISRQVGSFGDEIAALVAKKLHHQIIDNDRVHILAQEHDEDFKNACSLYSRQLFPGFRERQFANNPSYKSLFESINYELASSGNVVILGRGAQIVLRDVEEVLDVRIIAPEQIRVKRIMEQKNITQHEALDYIRLHDHNRRVLIESIYMRSLDDMYLYDLVISTAFFDEETAADVVCLAARERQKTDNDKPIREKLKRMALSKRIESAIRKQVISTHLKGIETSLDSDGVLTLIGYIRDKQDGLLAESIARSFSAVSEVKSQLLTNGL